MRAIFATVAVAVLAGCANPNLVGVRGNAVNTNYALQDRRAAKLHVQVTPALPTGAVVLGELSVERCHQYAQDDPPTDATLTDDLVLRAYSDGAEGITGLKFTRESGLMKNCWHIARGTANAFKAP